jgi:hypothetical protein
MPWARHISDSLEHSAELKSVSAAASTKRRDLATRRSPLNADVPSLVADCLSIWPL